MADYSTHFLFFVPGTREQSPWLSAVNEIVREFITCEDEEDDFGLGTCAVPDTGNQVLIHPAAELARQFAWLGEPGITISCHEQEVGGVWIASADGLGNAEYAAVLTQSYLRHIASDVVIAFAWSFTCSPPRPDGFGGGAAMVTRDRVDLFDTRTLIAEAIERERVRTNTINLSEKGRDGAVHDTRRTKRGDEIPASEGQRREACWRQMQATLHID
jgi:hypothetical protein